MPSDALDGLASGQMDFPTYITKCTIDMILKIVSRIFKSRLNYRVDNVFWKINASNLAKQHLLQLILFSKTNANVIY